MIGGSISILTNLIATSTGKKELKEAILDSAKETAIAAGVGYGTNFSGSTIKAFLQQSTNQGLKKLSNTSFPAMVVSTCLAAGRSIRKYAEGEINATEMTQEMSLTVSGMLSASSFAAIGQLAIPVPVLGAMIGSLIGYTLTNTFYQSFFDVLKNKNLSIERRRQIEQDCEIAKQSALEFERRVKDIFAQRVQELEHYSSKMFAALDNPNSSIEEFTTAMNDFANILGKKLSINSIAELDAIMLSDEPLIF
ncbi:hypothetical protein [Rappaport israeli]|uniref:hypothetical protein n=1 Tax=Rappaport israeli TaxID=1839807 RepID=UPI00099023F4|nr:hypothetical protein [Rappaport israeli]